jgi:anti-repressor protein
MSTTNTTTDLVIIENNLPTTTSLKIAEYFGKDHSKILRDIKKLLESGEINGANFGLVSYKDIKGEMRPMYQITKDGFTLLTMGFTGSKALKFKVDYINAFNKMEQTLRNQIQATVKEFSLDQLLEQNQNWIIKLSKQVETLKIEVEEAKPAVEFTNQVNQAINSITVADFAKVLGTGEIRLYAWLRENGYLQTRPKNRPYQKFIDIDKTPIFRVIEKTYKDQSTGESKTYFQTLITGKGQVYLTQKYQTNQSKFQMKILENS